MVVYTLRLAKLETQFSLTVAPAHTRIQSAAPTILDDLGDNKLQIKPAICKPAQSHDRPIGDPCHKPPERRHRHNRSEHEVTQSSRCSPGKSRQAFLVVKQRGPEKMRKCGSGVVVPYSPIPFRARCHRLGQCWNGHPPPDPT